jgi:hypothetical protein
VIVLPFYHIVLIVPVIGTPDIDAFGKHIKFKYAPCFISGSNAEFLKQLLSDGDCNSLKIVV